MYEQIKVLVTGASGFIGGRLVEKLSAHGGFAVTALVRDTAKTYFQSTNGIQTTVADLSNRLETDKAVEGHHTVINLAHDFKRSRKYNVRCFTNLYAACTRHAVQHLVHVSSIVVYDDWPAANLTEHSSCGRPGTEYKNTKLEIERVLQRGSDTDSLHSTILQPTIVYGPGSWIWTDNVVEKLLTGTVILPAGVKGICNAVYVDDVADALVSAVLNPGCSGDKYIISGPDTITWPEFFETFDRYLGTNSIQYLDVDVLADMHSGSIGRMKHLLANPMQLASRRPFRHVLNFTEKILGGSTVRRLENLIKSIRGAAGPIMYHPTPGDLELYCATGVCSIERAKKELGYVPKVDFGKGFELTTEYIDTKLLGSRYP